METVIILKGASGRGKTPTLNLLIEHLIAKHSATIVYEEDYTPIINKDCFVILDVPGYGKVGIITYGDHGCEPAVRDTLAKCQAMCCQAVIGASHTRESSAYKTIYAMLWEFGHVNGAKTVETTTIARYKNWGANIDETHLNTICAENIAGLLFSL